MPLRNKNLLLPIILFIGTFVLYAHNLSRAVYGGDVGDLLSAAVVGGVAHPPGYPLFSLLGFFLSKINLINPAFMIGLISVFASSLSVVLYYYFSLKVTKSYLISLISASILSFNYLFWFYTEIAEVFALNNLFVVALFFTAYIFYKTKKIKYLYLLSFLAGLSLTNHHTIILLFPSLFILFFSEFKQVISKPKNILKITGLFILGFSVYLYVPIASYFNPPINWDNVRDIKSFFHLLLRQDYGTFSAGAFAKTIAAQKVVLLNVYFFNLITQLTIPVVIIGFLGMIHSIRKEKIIFISIILGFFLSGPFFIGYSGFPIVNSFMMGVYERFFIMSSVVFLFFIPFGFLLFREYVFKIVKNQNLRHLLIGVFFIIPAFLFYYNFPKTDLHEIYIGNALAKDILRPLPKNSILFLTGDTPVFNTWYVYYGLKYRNDIKIVNANMLEADKFIFEKFNEYKRNHPEVKNKDKIVIGLIKDLNKKRPVFSIVQLQEADKKDLVWLPYGLTYKLLNSKEEIPSKEDFLKTQEEIWSQFDFFKQHKPQKISSNSLTISQIPSNYSDVLVGSASFILANYNDNESALSYFKKALEIFPENNKAYIGLAIYYSNKNDCIMTKKVLEKAIELNPLETISYSLLYLNNKSCLKNNAEADKILKLYKNTFKSDLVRDINSKKNN